jgi:hypothetical protein
MHVVRVHANSYNLFQTLLTKLNISSSIVHTISNGAAGNFGIYINPDVSAYGFLSGDKAQFDRLEKEVQLDAVASQTYKHFCNNEFFF